jgi:hypothetical protein
MILETALFWTSRLVLFSLLIQTLEFIWTYRSRSNDGIWKFATLQSELETVFLIGKIGIRILFSSASIQLLLAIRILVIAYACVQPNLNSFLVLLLSHLILCWRYRGTYNGGSDMITLMTLLGLAMSYSFPDDSPMRTFGLFFISVHSISSYFLSGVYKLKKKSWQDGTALSIFLKKNWPLQIMKILSWGALCFEVGFPLSLVNLKLAYVFIALAFVFHTLNAVLLGLTRFLFAWAATWPAILFVTAYLHKIY